MLSKEYPLETRWNCGCLKRVPFEGDGPHSTPQAAGGQFPPAALLLGRGFSRLPTLYCAKRGGPCRPSRRWRCNRVKNCESSFLRWHLGLVLGEGICLPQMFGDWVYTRIGVMFAAHNRRRVLLPIALKSPAGSFLPM